MEVCACGEGGHGRGRGWELSIFCFLVTFQLRLETRASISLRACSICSANSHSSQQAQFRMRSDSQIPFSQNLLSKLDSVDSFASYFSEKIEAVKKEFPQAPTTTSTHLHASVTEYSVSSPVTMDEPSVLRAKASPSTCTVDPILPALFRKIIPVVLCFFIFSLSFSAGFFPPT